MRITHEAYVENSFPLTYPTTGEEVLTLWSEDDYKFDYEFELTLLPSYHDDLPTDAVQCRFWVADSDGVVWTTSVRFTGEELLNTMDGAGSIERSYCPDNDTSDDSTTAPDRVVTPLVTGARYSSDDRFSRRLIVHDKIVEVPFHYLSIQFDISYVKDDIEEEIRVDLRGFRDANGDALPAFRFAFDPVDLWTLGRTVSFHEERCRTWCAFGLPIPLVFEKTDVRSAPNGALRSRKSPMRPPETAP
jgi:hypothetical protein